MPLEHSASDKAFEKNLKTELANDKDPKQALAIAYAEKRRAGGKDKYARGDTGGDMALHLEKIADAQEAAGDTYIARIYREQARNCRGGK